VPAEVEVHDVWQTLVALGLAATVKSYADTPTFSPREEREPRPSPDLCGHCFGDDESMTPIGRELAAIEIDDTVRVPDDAALSRAR